MSCAVYVIGSEAVASSVGDAVVGTATTVVRLTLEDLWERIDLGVDLDLVAAIVLGPDFGQAVIRQVARRLPPEEAHRLVVVRRPADIGDVTVPWLVVLEKETPHFVARLVEDAEATTVDLLARIGTAAQTTTRLGCVISIASTFILVASDDDVDVATVRFVLPGHGAIVVVGQAEPVASRPGVFRVRPEEPSVREALLAFTKRRAERL